ncbi:hypothetical protein QQF64_032122 [Cirrhinus molitorella]|uniref:Uncharacterized protein n=1 Tax=Cirrhinus molitorella TaxID=172907 RepID=A0ABR3MYY2_9TELE
MLLSLAGETEPPLKREGFTQEKKEEKITEDGGMREKRTGYHLEIILTVQILDNKERYRAFHHQSGANRLKLAQWPTNEQVGQGNRTDDHEDRQSTYHVLILRWQRPGNSRKEERDVNMRRALVLRALPVYLREDSSKFFRTCNSADGPDLTDTPVALLTVVTDDTTDASLFSPESICIVVEDEILVSGPTNLADSFLLLFGTFQKLPQACQKPGTGVEDAPGRESDPGLPSGPEQEGKAGRFCVYWFPLCALRTFALSLSELPLLPFFIHYIPL